MQPPPVPTLKLAIPTVSEDELRDLNMKGSAALIRISAADSLTSLLSLIAAAQSAGLPTVLNGTEVSITLCTIQ